MSETSVWIIIGYVALFIVMNVSGLIWLRMTAEPKVKNNPQKTVDWNNND